jgi:hypothetical protein
MQYDSLAAFQADRTELGKGPFAVVICEDRTEVGSTLDHVFGLGFQGRLHGGRPRISATKPMSTRRIAPSTPSANRPAARTSRKMWSTP